MSHALQKTTKWLCGDVDVAEEETLPYLDNPNQGCHGFQTWRRVLAALSIPQNCELFFLRFGAFVGKAFGATKWRLQNEKKVTLSQT